MGGGQRGGAVGVFGDLDVVILGERGGGVAEAGGHDLDGDAGVEQQGGVQMPQPVRGGMAQPAGLQRLGEVGGQAGGVDAAADLVGELVPRLEPGLLGRATVPSLDLSPLPQDLDGRVVDSDLADGGLGFGSPSYSTLWTDTTFQSTVITARSRSTDSARRPQISDRRMPVAARTCQTGYQRSPRV